MIKILTILGSLEFVATMPYLELTFNFSQMWLEFCMMKAVLGQDIDEGQIITQNESCGTRWIAHNVRPIPKIFLTPHILV